MPDWRNTAESYGVVARALHWAIGLLLLAQLTLGVVTFELLERGAERSALAGIHKALGVVLLMMVLARLAWRSYDPVPEPPPSMCQAELRGARLGHALLYLLMMVVPVLGLLVSDTSGRATDVFGLFTVPEMVGEHEDLHDAFELAHKIGAYTLLAMIVVHVAGVVYHQLYCKDGVLRRML